MLLYTVVPPELIFEEEAGAAADPPAAPIEIQKGSVRLMVDPLPGGQGRISQIISTNPQDYLNPAWQPGTIMSIF